MLHAHTSRNFTSGASADAMRHSIDAPSERDAKLIGARPAPTCSRTRVFECACQWHAPCGLLPGKGGATVDLTVDDDRRAGSHVLSSHFQPIFSLAHRQPVGYEGLVRARDAAGRALSPEKLFAGAPLGEARVRLDRQCRRLHLRNFLQAGDARSWLFLNVDPYVATEGTNYGSFFAQLLESSGFPPQRVAIELIESPTTDETALAAAVDYY